ncbi:MAG: Fe-S cluster assembly protein SufD, partial [Thermomicrobiales bacterium]
MMNETTQGFRRAAVEALSAARQEPAWVLQKRLDAWEAYERIPMPTLRDEEWRRTDLKGLKMDTVLPYGPVLDERGIPAEIADVLENAEERGGLFIQHDASTIHA